MKFNVLDTEAAYRRLLDSADAEERLAIMRALDQYGGNRTHAANRLGISVRTLQRKLRQYELERRVKPLTDVMAQA